MMKTILKIREALTMIANGTSILMSAKLFAWPHHLRTICLFTMSLLLNLQKLVSMLTLSSWNIKLLHSFERNESTPSPLLKTDISLSPKWSKCSRTLARSKSMSNLVQGGPSKQSRVPITVEFPFEENPKINCVYCTSPLAWTTDPYAELRAACCHALSLCAFRSAWKPDEDNSSEQCRYFAKHQSFQDGHRSGAHLLSA